MPQNLKKYFPIKLALSLLFITAIAVSALGATWALFSDIEESRDNPVSLATLDLQVGDNNPSTLSFNFNNLSPANSPEWVTANIRSIGDIAGDFWMEIITKDSSEGKNPEPETNIDPADGGELEECAEARVTFNNTPLFDFTPVASLATEWDKGWGSDIDAWVESVSGANFKLEVRTTNCTAEAMGDSFNLDLVFHLDQTS